MNMNGFTNGSPCFSGDCGLCNNCCGNYQAGHTITEELNKTQRATDHIKFTKSDLEKLTQEYWRGLRKIYLDTEYSSPSQPGGLPRIYHTDNYPHSSDIYRLHMKCHEKVCHMPLCQMMYQDTHEHQRSVYNILPVYVGEHCTLCAPCIRKIGKERMSLL